MASSSAVRLSVGLVSWLARANWRRSVTRAAFALLLLPAPLLLDDIGTMLRSLELQVGPVRILHLFFHQSLAARVRKMQSSDVAM